MCIHKFNESFPSLPRPLSPVVAEVVLDKFNRGGDKFQEQK